MQTKHTKHTRFWCGKRIQPTASVGSSGKTQMNINKMKHNPAGGPVRSLGSEFGQHEHEGSEAHRTEAAEQLEQIYAQLKTGKTLPLHATAHGCCNTDTIDNDAHLRKTAQRRWFEDCSARNGKGGDKQKKKKKRACLPGAVDNSWGVFVPR